MPDLAVSIVCALPRRLGLTNTHRPRQGRRRSSGRLLAPPKDPVRSFPARSASQPKIRRPNSCCYAKHTNLLLLLECAFEATEISGISHPTETPSSSQRQPYTRTPEPTLRLPDGHTSVLRLSRSTRELAWLEAPQPYLPYSANIPPKT